MPERGCSVHSLGSPHLRWHQARHHLFRQEGVGAGSRLCLSRAPVPSGATWKGGRGGGMTEAGILLGSRNDKCLPLGTLRVVLQDHPSQLQVICIPTGWEGLLPTAPASHPVPTPAQFRMRGWSRRLLEYLLKPLSDSPRDTTESLYLSREPLSGKAKALPGMVALA